ncbi:MAG: hypothetical protein AAEJ52_06645 [Myxococcota bacterium]
MNTLMAVIQLILVPVQVPSDSGCIETPQPNVLTEETFAYLTNLSMLEHATTEQPWFDLYVSSEETGHYPLGDNANSGEDPSEPLRNFYGIQSRLDSLTDRCGIRINLDWADSFSGSNVRSIAFHPTCTDPQNLGIWLRSSLPGTQVQVDCTNWGGFSALFAFRDNAGLDGGWSAVENVNVAWCDEDLFSAPSGTKSHGLVLNSGGVVSGPHQILTSHSAGSGFGNEIVAINSYGTASGGIPIQPGSYGKITAIGRGTFSSSGPSLYANHGTINVVGHFFNDGPEPPGDTDRRLLSHRLASSTSGHGLDLMLVNVGARTESNSKNPALRAQNSGCLASGAFTNAKLFKVTTSGWHQGYGGFALNSCDQNTAQIEAGCVDISDNEKMFILSPGMTPANLDIDMRNSIWDDEPGGGSSWSYDGVEYATREEFVAASGNLFTNVMGDSSSQESAGPGVDGNSFSDALDPSVVLPGNGTNRDSIEILADPSKEAYGLCTTRFTNVLDPAVPAIVSRWGVAIDTVDMNRCGTSNIGYQ